MQIRFMSLGGQIRGIVSHCPQEDLVASEGSIFIMQVTIEGGPKGGVGLISLSFFLFIYFLLCS